MACVMCKRFSPEVRSWNNVFRVVSKSLSKSPDNAPESLKDAPVDDFGFRTLELYPKKQTVNFRHKKHRDQQPPLTPRYTRMHVDQDWTNVWPTAHTFKASVVPLPLRMGFNENGAPPGKYGNAELMKIPNFFHLTPPAIKKHCAAIAKFCTRWPDGLKNDRSIQLNFPVTVITSDYCYSGPSLRNPSSRIVTVHLKLSSIQLDEHARDKLLRLVGERYNSATDILTLVIDRCPLRKQNYDYAIYLLTALFNESWKTDEWERDKELSDMEKYVWNGSKSQYVIMQLVKNVRFSNQDAFASTSHPTDQDVVDCEAVVKYGEAVTKMHNDVEDAETIKMYKNSVKSILNL